MNKVKVACLFAGIVECWHEHYSEHIKHYDGKWDGYGPCTEAYSRVVGYYCLDCGKELENSLSRPDPLHNDGDYWRLVKGMMEDTKKWDWFTGYCMLRWSPWGPDDFTRWLLKDPARFLDLIWGWTGQEEVQEKWGWRDCQFCTKGKQEITPIDTGRSYVGPCNHCDGSGKLLAPWLKERRKG